MSKQYDFERRASLHREEFVGGGVVFSVALSINKIPLGKVMSLHSSLLFLIVYPKYSVFRNSILQFELKRRIKRMNGKISSPTTGSTQYIKN
jgi:hypothetical protein